MRAGVRAVLLGRLPGAPVEQGVWRGFNQASRIAVQGFNNAAGRMARTCRNRRYSCVPFRRFRIAIPVFYLTGTPVADTLYSGAQAQLSFQIGFEYPYTPALSGLAPRIPVTFSGVNSTSYDNATWNPATGYILSDVIDLGFYVRSFFGLWVTVELPTTGTNVLPYTVNGSNFLQRYLGVNDSATSAISAGTALTATSIGAMTSAQAGGSNMFDPCVMLIEVPRNSRSAVTVGDSIAYGVGESVAGSGSFGDSMGSALSNSGFIDRGLYEYARINNLNLGRGSDAARYASAPANSRYRMQLAALANPTHVICQLLHNDMSYTFTAATWNTATAYVKHTVLTSGGNFYICTQAGTSGGGANPLSGTGQAISDNTCVWRYMGGSLGGAAQNGAYQVIGDLAKMLDLLRAAAPNAAIYQTTCTPDAATTDAYATTLNQTPNTGYAASNSRRFNTNAKIRTPDAALGTVRVLDQNTLLEDGWPGSETGKWVVDGSANYAVFDGTHPNSHGASIAAPLFSGFG
jgi:lysophospholipase L1-like esterase